MGEVPETNDVKKPFIPPAIKSFDHYDFTRAKISCSLTWLVDKAFGTDGVPGDLKVPYYTDQYEQEHLKPAVVSLLLSADLYCRAGSLILADDDSGPLEGHEAVIQALAQRGLYVTDQDRLVTERDLGRRPLQMSAHLALTDALMAARASDTLGVAKVAACLRRYSAPGDPDAETPYDPEDAATTWVNKVNEYLKDVVAQELRKRETQSSEPVGVPRSPTKWYMKLVPARYRKEQACSQLVPWVPPVDNLLKDTADGAALAALLHFFCPQLLSLEDVCLKENMSLADRLNNLQKVQDFCRDNLKDCCHFSLEDMLYAPSSIKNNYLAFMADLFWWFEVVKPSFVKPRVLENEEPGSLLKNLPSVPISMATKRSFMERPPSPDRPSLPLRPQPRKSGEMRKSASMSFVDGNTTWPKEKRSCPYGVSFDIPFENDGVLARGMTRSASTDDAQGFKVHALPPRGVKRNLSFQPVNGSRLGIEEEEEEEEEGGCPDSLAGPEPTARRASGRQARPNGHGARAAPPSMEEALRIIHSPGAADGFFLHGPGGGLPAASEPHSASSSSGPPSGTDTGVHLRTEDVLDEDSSLRDCSAHAELDPDSPGSGGPGKSPCGGARMTSFAEQKMRKLSTPGAPDSGRGSSSGGGSSLKTTPEGSELGLPLSVSWAPTPEHSPVRGRGPPDPPAPAALDPAQAMATEMVELRMRLEEKRKAIEAQKRKVEAAFARHRQRSGRSAFLAVVTRKGDGAASGAEEEEEGEEGERPGRSMAVSPDRPEQGAQSPRCPKSPRGGGGGAEEGDAAPGPGAGSPEVDLAEYTRSIDKLNHSLGFLQTEMQRLARQQDLIMAMRERKQPLQQAWVVAAPPPAQPPPRPAAKRSSDPPSPADSPRAARRSPARRKSASFHARHPRTPRPCELKLAPCSRVLAPPQSVDSIPRLRRFSPGQPPAGAPAPLGEDQAPAAGGGRSPSPLLLSPDQEEGSLAADTPPVSPHGARRRVPEDQGEGGTERREAEGEQGVPGLAPARAVVEEALAHAVTESFTVTPTATPTEAPARPLSPGRGSLLEVPLSVLKPLEGGGLEESGERTQGAMEGLLDDEKMCCGFFLKGEGKGEEDMAQRRAAMLEKRMRREKETLQRKMQLEAEGELKKEEARLKAEEERQRKEEERVRKEFIKQEHLRRKQLKLMEDMDTVLQPRAAGARQRRNPRPRSIHRDGPGSPGTPVRTAAGSRARVFSVSSLSLASLSLGGDEDGSGSLHSETRASRSASLASGSLHFCLGSPNLRRRRGRRPDSADGFLSLSRSGSRNGEDWENGSTTSSVTSNTEYTGPKLYKELSTKSNKHIIQNALAHCCMAGKVNEGPKSKILEEMEKSEANNFLVLFRDAGCQFRSLYTYCPESEAINKLAGMGPKSITRKMIDGLYKYNSDKKQFSQIPAKTMSGSVDAITIHSYLWHTKKPATPKKVVPAAKS